MGLFQKLNDWLDQKKPAPYVEPVATPSGPLITAKSTYLSLSGNTITIKDLKEDRPNFGRKYSCQLTLEVRVDVEIKWFCGGLLESGILHQRNGSWVSFNPKRVAEKIIDRELAPIVQDFSSLVLKEDMAFRKSKPSEYVDDEGQRWIRAN